MDYNPEITLYVSFYVSAGLAFIGIIIYGAKQEESFHFGYSFGSTVMGSIGITIAGILAVVNAVRAPQPEYATH